MAAPDRDTGAAVDLPRAVATDRRGLLVDTQDGRAARRLEGQQRRKRLRPCVVVGQDGRVGHDPEAGPPAKRPEQPTTAKIEVATRQGHRPGRTAGKRGAAVVRGHERAPDGRPLEDRRQVARLAAREIDQVGFADRLDVTVVIGVGAVPDEDRLDFRAQLAEMLDAQRRPAFEDVGTVGK